MKINGVKGMNDILPAAVGRWQEIERVAREVFALHGYREVRTPVVEPYALYARGVGEATDIVNKEMYVFEDKGEEKLALRPEGTAGTVRAYIEHGAHVEGPQKWFYVGPMFRRERPQKGRYRQFHQIGVEAFGIAEPAIDVEQIAMLADLFRQARRRAGGAREQRRRRRLPPRLPRGAAHLAARARRARSAPTAGSGPSGIHCGCSTARCPPASRCWPTAPAPPRAALRRAAGPTSTPSGRGSTTWASTYQVNPRLVRGLDYYVRTAYEFTSDALGSQSAVAGGGRYDGLVETLGGPPTPGIGFGMGEERLALILEAAGRPGARDPSRGLLRLCRRGRAAGGAAAGRRAAPRRRAPATSTPAGGKLARQFKQAERVGARYAVVIGGNEASSGQAKLKDMATREEVPVALAELAARFRPGPA